MMNTAGIVAMSVVGIDLLIFGGYSVKSSVACFWRANVVLQTDIDHDRTGYPRTKVYTVEVRQRIAHRLSPVRIKP